MSDSSDSAPKIRRTRRPRKVVSDEARLARLLEEFKAAHAAISTEQIRRQRLALELNELGLTTTKIAPVVGVSQVTISKWVRTAREEREGPSDG